MGIEFQFATASQIIFGSGSADKVPGLISGLGKKVLFVTGKNQELSRQLREQVGEAGYKTEIFSVISEPYIDVINTGVELARKSQCEVVVGIGGGSVIDSAKAIAAMTTNPGDLIDYLEVIGKEKSLTQKPVPCIAVPTTSGTGAEVTKNSVIHSPGHKVKVSLRSKYMYPDFAVVDPLLTLSMPPHLTANTGLDALTHLLETFVSNQANPFIDVISRKGMELIAASLKKAFYDGTDQEARENMAMASLLGGMALANVKLGAVHGFAGPMGGMFPAPHGTICACLLPAVMETNIAELRKRGHKVGINKYCEVTAILTGDKNASPEDGILWAKKLVSELMIPSLTQIGITSDDFPELVQKAKNASSMKGNPVELNDNQLMAILEKSM